MTDNTETPEPEEASEPPRRLTARAHALASIDAITWALGAADADAKTVVTPEAWATIAAAHAMLSVAAQVGRIADWIEGVELTSPPSEDEPATARTVPPWERIDFHPWIV